VNREAKLVGFALLLVLVFLGAHAAGARLGPVSTSRSHVSYTSPQNPGGGGMSGMGPGR
jgi:hypothetical protein